MNELKRYQIFVSSTFADLEDERGKVMETILKFDCFPAGMELFPAMDEEQFKYIKRIIDDSDYYLLIIGGRYGSVDDSGVSWTEKEYNYAVSKGIPVIAYLRRDITQLKEYWTEQDNKKRKSLETFREKVSKGRLIQKWSNADDLALAVATSLKRVLDLQPRTGWVRADKVVSNDSKNEIDRLQKEIADRQKYISTLLAYVEGLEADLKKKNESNQSNQKTINELNEEIKNYKERIKTLETELDKYKTSSITTDSKSKIQTESFAVNGVSFKMIRVDGGTFFMGANQNDKDAFSDEKPTHQVTLSDFWIGETLVTQALWSAVMSENPSHFTSDPNLPVENVSWVDCKEFIRKLNKLTGKKFRLPTEAQWEFAARGGNRGKSHHYRYAGNNDVYDVAWFEGNSKGKTHPVGELDPNELGLYDMTGNVWEWCNDWFGKSYFSYSPTIDPLGPTTGASRVSRGGGWNGSVDICRVSYRSFNFPSDAYNYLGLRLAL